MGRKQRAGFMVALAMEGRLDDMQYLFDAKPDTPLNMPAPPPKWKRAITPLYAAAIRGHTHVVRWLLETLDDPAAAVGPHLKVPRCSPLHGAGWWSPLVCKYCPPLLHVWCCYH